MPLTRLELSNFRILERVVIEPGEGLNVITGCNAAGKTTLIEAIHILATGRSFRTQRLTELVRHGVQGFSAYGVVVEGGGPHRLGFAVGAQGRSIRIDGERVTSAAALAQHMPLLAVTPEHHYEFLRSSRYRRGLLDWWLFHVEPDFHCRWLRYQKVLAQRNAALRQRSPIHHIWDEELSDLGEAITRSRDAFFIVLEREFHRASEYLLGDGGARLIFESGWCRAESLLMCLLQNRANDQRHGYTRQGPHRADLRFELHKEGIRTHLSHGQQKLLVIALRLSQLKLFIAQSGRPCILLADDLGAELDAAHRQRVQNSLESLGAQAFLTSMDDHPLSTTASTPVFHVEQGRIRTESTVLAIPKKSARPEMKMLE